MTDTPVVSPEVASRLVATMERRRLPLAALLAATGSSLLGRQLATVAIPCAVYSATGSLARAGLTATCLIFPWLLTDPAGNAAARRLGDKAASIAAGILGGAMVAAIPTFHLTARLPFASALLAVVLFASITALGSASRHALMHEAAGVAGIPVDRVRTALRTTAQAAVLTGPLLAGLGIAHGGTDLVLWIAAAGIALAAAADLVQIAPATTPASGHTRTTDLSAALSQRVGGTLDRPQGRP